MKKFFSRIASVIAALLGVSNVACAATPAPTTVNHPDWSRQAVIYEVNTRQFTPEGTFDAMSEHLPRLKDLGVDILWFMPIHPISELNRKGGLGSYYAVRDYKGVNPEFGDLDSFRSLVDKAHAQGMKVIIDWVPNHTGCDNAWVTEHPDWFKLDENGKMYGPFDWTDVYQLDYDNKDMRKAMIDAMKFWITDAGIDGFRCDVAGRVPVDFWNECRAELEKAKGEGQLFMLAEAPDAPLLEHAFDMDYNWPMKDLQNAVAATRGEYRYVAPGADKPAELPVKNADDIIALVNEQAQTYPEGSYMMNMITNHDLNSWEGTEYERYGKYLPAMTVLTYVLPGMPLIYTGQEVALDRALEFFFRDPVGEFASLNQPASRGSRTTAMYKVLNDLKHRYPQLAAGQQNIDFAKVADPENQLLIIRSLPDEDASIFCAINFGTTAMTIPAMANIAKEIYFFGADGLMPKSNLLEPGEALIAVMPKF